MTRPTANDPRFLAGLDMLRRAGAIKFRIGYSDETEGDPVVWHVVATWELTDGHVHHEVGAGLDPVAAMMRVCEDVIDGGHCVHCHRMTIFVSALDELSPMLDAMGCVYAYDPERRTFRRSCEGDT